MTKKKTTIIIIIAAVAAVAALAVCLLLPKNPHIDVSGYRQNTNNNLAFGVPDDGCGFLAFDGEDLYRYRDIYSFFVDNKSLGFLNGIQGVNNKNKSYEMKRNDILSFAFDKGEIIYFIDSGGGRNIYNYMDIRWAENLYIKNPETGEERFIDEAREDYQLSGDGIYYLKFDESKTYDTGYLYSMDLWRYDRVSGEREFVSKDVLFITVSDEVLYLVSKHDYPDNDTKRYGERTYTYNIDTFDTASGERTPYCSFDLDFIAERFLITHNKVFAFNINSSNLYRYDTEKSVGTDIIEENTQIGDKKIIVNRNNKYLFVSSCFYRLEDQTEWILDNDYFRHGLWRYDIETGEWLRLSAKYYNSLFVFDESTVWGVELNWRGNVKIYKIAVDGSGETLIR